jgi:hypothetical protein
VAGSWNVAGVVIVIQQLPPAPGHLLLLTHSLSPRHIRLECDLSTDPEHIGIRSTPPRHVAGSWNVASAVTLIQHLPPAPGHHHLFLTRSLHDISGSSAISTPT